MKFDLKRLSKKLLPQSPLTVADVLMSLDPLNLMRISNFYVLSFLVNLICAGLFIKIYDLMTLSMNLKKPNVFFFTLGNMDI